MKETLRRLWHEEEAAVATEYGLIVAVVAVVMIFIPWIAEAEPKSLSIEETTWLATIIDSPDSDLIGNSHYHAFYDGKVYVSGEWYVLRNSSYVDLPGISFFLIVRHPDSRELGRVVTGLLLPIGIGVASDGKNTLLLNRVKTNWTPPKE